MLRHMLQVMQYASGTRLLLNVGDPDFRKALIWRQLTHHATQVLALHAGDDAFNPQCIRPQCGDGEVRSLG